MPVLFCCVETRRYLLYSEVELVGAAIAVDMVNRERFIAVNSELPHMRGVMVLSLQRCTNAGSCS